MNPEKLLKHADFVRSLARSLVVDDHQAADVAQQTWLAALENPPDRKKPLRSWLSRVVRNFACRIHRSESRRRKYESAAPAARRVTSPDEVLEKEKIRRRLIEAVLALKEPYRTALVMRYYDGLQPREIAEQLHMSVERVWTHLKRGLLQLRERFDAQH